VKARHTLDYLTKQQPVTTICGAGGLKMVTVCSNV